MADLTHAHRRALMAAAMSLVVPGLGQLVNREYVVGLFWLVLAPLFWYSTRSWLAWTVHVLAALSAYWAVQRAYGGGRPARRRRTRR
jgi:hypothetical protein